MINLIVIKRITQSINPITKSIVPIITQSVRVAL